MYSQGDATHVCTYSRKEPPDRPKSELHQRPARWATALFIGSARSVGEGLLTGARITPGCCVTKKPILTRVTIKKAEFLEQCAPSTGMSIGPRLPSHSCWVSSSLSSCWPLKQWTRTLRILEVPAFSDIWHFVYLLRLPDSQFGRNCYRTRKWLLCKEQPFS